MNLTEAEKQENLAQWRRDCVKGGVAYAEAQAAARRVELLQKAVEQEGLARGRAIAKAFNKKRGLA